MRREGDGGSAEKQRYKGAERGRQRRREGRWMRGEEEERKM